MSEHEFIMCEKCYSGEEGPAGRVYCDSCNANRETIADLKDKRNQACEMAARVVHDKNRWRALFYDFAETMKEMSDENK